MLLPGLLDLKEEQFQYEIVCHIHTKKSTHFDWGEKWGKYLFDNLISPVAIKDIVNHFSSSDDLGIVFPPIYKGILNFWVKNSFSHLGLFNLLEVCDDLLVRMAIKKELDRNSVFFSVGNMFWYRPKALKPLFDLGLTYNDFPKEPIKVDGTIANAIERLHAIIAEEQGYRLYVILLQIIY